MYRRPAPPVASPSVPSVPGDGDVVMWFQAPGFLLFVWGLCLSCSGASLDSVGGARSIDLRYQNGTLQSVLPVDFII